MRLFFRSAGVVLLLTATAKLISAFGTKPILYRADPVFALETRYLLVIIGCIELIVGIAVMLQGRELMKSILLYFLGAEFLLYRFTLLAIGDAPCPCLGIVTYWMRMDQRNVNGLLWATATYLCVGGIYYAFRLHQRPAELVST